MVSTVVIPKKQRQCEYLSTDHSHAPIAMFSKTPTGLNITGLSMCLLATYHFRAASEYLHLESKYAEASSSHSYHSSGCLERMKGKMSRPSRKNVFPKSVRTNAGSPGMQHKHREPGHNIPVVYVCRDLVTRWQSVLFQVFLGEEVEGFLWIKSRLSSKFSSRKQCAQSRETVSLDRSMRILRVSHVLTPRSSSVTIMLSSLHSSTKMICVCVGQLVVVLKTARAAYFVTLTSTAGDRVAYTQRL